MSKLLCTCGQVIFDQTDFLPYKAAIVADEDSERLWGEMARGLADMVKAARDGQMEAWVGRHFGSAGDGLDDESLVSDYQLRFAVRFTRTVYQCEQCGRLWVEDPRRENELHSFVPEDAAAAGKLVTRSTSR